MKFKQFKDPNYGYIDIESSIVAEIIDTPEFQRLKNIRQTSYAPLYPSAHHNRFTHSLGVYHLGKIAFGAINDEIIRLSKKTKLEKKHEKLKEIFELSCLLHDVGHAPFSHTGEIFFLNEEKTLYADLKSTVNCEMFTKDFDSNAKDPAPHECMSCIVALKTFSKHFKDSFERSLFARCIIGLKIGFNEKEPDINVANTNFSQLDEYKKTKKEIELQNCIISLLNSSIIDVDRLDYIIRDAETIGFQNVKIDYMRLLQGTRIVERKDGYQIGYHKNALSVIESAVYAHDSEKKWIQNHPVILYEMEAIKSAIRDLNSLFGAENRSNPLFCYEALTTEGTTISLDITSDNKPKNYDGINISLFADEDLLHLIKRFCKDSFGYEYFARNKRGVSVWKSEAEFRAIF